VAPAVAADFRQGERPTLLEGFSAFFRSRDRPAAQLHQKSLATRLTEAAGKRYLRASRRLKEILNGMPGGMRELMP
jgi:hypothetical protein